MKNQSCYCSCSNSAFGGTKGQKENSIFGEDFWKNNHRFKIQYYWGLLLLLLEDVKNPRVIDIFSDSDNFISLQITLYTLTCQSKFGTTLLSKECLQG